VRVREERRGRGKEEEKWVGNQQGGREGVVLVYIRNQNNLRYTS
jgi:hypothetical protein